MKWFINATICLAFIGMGMVFALMLMHGVTEGLLWGALATASIGAVASRYGHAVYKKENC